MHDKIINVLKEKEIKETKNNNSAREDLTILSSINDIHTYEIGLFMKKYNCKKLPSVFKNYFESIQNYHTYSTCLSKAQYYFLPRTSKKFGQKHISCTGTKVWQSIPQSLKTCPSINFQNS